MRRILLLGAMLSALIWTAAPQASATTRYLGGDISLLPEYKDAGARYYNHSGTRYNDVLDLFADEEMNSMRVRLFVDPSAYTGSDADANACQDLDYIKPLCKQIKDAGFSLVLDFHYSDFWADPVKQYTPAAWASMTDSQLYSQIYTYTKNVLTELVAYGATPDFIQTGNEISYGMLWGPVGTSSANQKKCYSGSSANWSRFTTLLSRASQACREVCPNAKIILHTERTARDKNSILLNFYNQMASASVDYDIIGLSYYPYYHGTVSDLEYAITSLENNFPSKPIQIVEFGYPYKYEISGDYADYTTYPASDAGQLAVTTDLITMLNNHDSVTGLYWWWMEYNAYNTSLSGWYNAPLFDSTTGRATSALAYLKNFLTTEVITDDYPSTLSIRSTASGNAELATISEMAGQDGVYRGTLTGASAWQNFLIVDEDSGTWYGSDPSDRYKLSSESGKYNCWLDGTAGDYIIDVNLTTLTWSFTLIDSGSTNYPTTLSVRAAAEGSALLATLTAVSGQEGVYSGTLEDIDSSTPFIFVDEDTNTWYGCNENDNTALDSSSSKWNCWVSGSEAADYTVTVNLADMTWSYTEIASGPTYPATLSVRQAAEGSPLLATLTGSDGVYTGTVSNINSSSSFYFVDEDSGTWYGCNASDNSALDSTDDKWSCWVSSDVTGKYYITVDLVNNTWSNIHLPSSLTIRKIPTSASASRLLADDATNPVLATLDETENDGEYAGLLVANTTYLNFRFVDEDTDTWYGSADGEQYSLEADSDNTCWLNNDHTSPYNMTANLKNNTWSAQQTIVTSISAVGVNASDVKWYDLQGRQLRSAPSHGLFIRKISGKASTVFIP